MCDYEYVLVTVWFVKTRNCQRKSLRFYCVQFLRISTENILLVFKNRSRRARADQNDIKFVFWVKNCFLEFIIPLKNIYETCALHLIVKCIPIFAPTWSEPENESSEAVVWGSSAKKVSSKRDSTQVLSCELWEIFKDNFVISMTSFSLR